MHMNRQYIVHVVALCTDCAMCLQIMCYIELVHLHMFNDICSISCNRLGKSGSTAKAFLEKFLDLQTLKYASCTYHYIEFILVASLILLYYRVHLCKDFKWYMSMRTSNQLKDINVKMYISFNTLHAHRARSACCIAILNLVHLKSGYQKCFPYFFLFHRTVSASRGSPDEDLAICTE